MKTREILSIFGVFLILSIFSSSGQDFTEILKNKENVFGAFRTDYETVEEVDYKSEKTTGSAINMHLLLKHDMMNPDATGRVESRKITPNSVRGGITTSNDNSTVRTSTSAPKKSGNITQQNRNSKQAQIDRQAAFNEKRREQARLAAQKAAQKKAEEIRRENERVAMATAAANARLQPRTDANINQDIYNAGQGRTQAKQTARAAVESRKAGPQKIERQQVKTSGQTYSSSLKQSAQRDRTRKPRPLKRGEIKPARRMAPNSNGTYTLPARATKTSIHIKADPKIGNAKTAKYAPRTIRGNKGFVLDPNAVVTTGKPLPRVKNATRREIPEPVTRINVKPLTHEEEMDLKIKEFLQ